MAPLGDVLPPIDTRPTPLLLAHAPLLRPYYALMLPYAPL